MFFNNFIFISFIYIINLISIYFLINLFYQNELFILMILSIKNLIFFFDNIYILNIKEFILYKYGIIIILSILQTIVSFIFFLLFFNFNILKLKNNKKKIKETIVCNILKIIIIPYLYKINSLIFNNLENILLNFFNIKIFNSNFSYFIKLNYLFNFYDLITFILIIFFFKLFIILFLFLRNNFKNLIFFIIFFVIILFTPPDFFIQLKLLILFIILIEYTIFLKNFINYFIKNVFY